MGSHPEDHKRILIFARYFKPAFRAGGPIRTLSALVKEVGRNHRVRVIAGNRDYGLKANLPVRSNVWIQEQDCEIFFAKSSSVASILRGVFVARREKVTLVYVNSFFDLRFALFPILLTVSHVFNGATLLVAPRGEFGAGALGIRKRSKRIYLTIFRAVGLHKKAIWHASTDFEAQDIRRIFREDARVVVRQDETELPLKADPVSFAIPEGNIVKGVFLSRISPMKGLDILLEAVRDLKQELVLDIFGPEGDPEFASRCKRIAENVSNQVHLNFCGEVSHANVRDILKQYDVMFLPSRGENFGHVVPEALSVSLPVVASANTPWTGTLENGGGIVVKTNSVVEWTLTIERLLKMNREEINVLKSAAGTAYNEWSVSQGQPSVFDLV